MSCNDKLITSYFSSNPKVLESFYDDLEEKQSVITRKELCELKSNDLDDEFLTKILVGAIKYNKAYNKDVDISEISNYLDKFYMPDRGSWSDMINSSLSKYEETDSVTPMSR